MSRLKFQKFNIYIVFILFLFFMGFCVWLFVMGNFRQVKGVQDANGTEESSGDSLFGELNKPVYADPKRLLIESVDININLIPIGIEDDGLLEAPKDWKVGGWYKDGAKPGGKGNLIIDGHYDDNFGNPAAFWMLKNVLVDDTVVVFDDLGRWHLYRVENISFVNIDDPKRLDVLKNDENKSSLTIITCGGVWLQGKSTYDQRLVIQAKLVS